MTPEGAVEATARDARAEAAAAAGAGLDPRVLEPSPPAVTAAPWFADDPVALGARRPGTRLLSPLPGADVTWEQWVAGRPQHAGWAADRWLVARRRLGAPPPGFAGTRLALHRLAAFVLAPARRRSNGRIGLRWTLAGFGTPFFGDDEQVRVEGTRLVVQRGAGACSQPLTTLAEAARLVLGGPPDAAWAHALDLDVPEPGPAGAPLGLDRAAATHLADLFGFGALALERLRFEARSAAPTRVQLWPEHFDIAFECDGGGGRATFGLSPGSGTELPYLYALPPDPATAVRDPGTWDAGTFPGAALPVTALEGAGDQLAAALDWWRSRRAALGPS